MAGEDQWDSCGLSSTIFEFDSSRKTELGLPQEQWCSLNRLWTWPMQLYAIEVGDGWL